MSNIPTNDTRSRTTRSGDGFSGLSKSLGREDARRARLEKQIARARAGNSRTLTVRHVDPATLTRRPTADRVADGGW